MFVGDIEVGEDGLYSSEPESPERKEEVRAMGIDGVLCNAWFTTLSFTSVLDKWCIFRW